MEFDCTVPGLASQYITVWDAAALSRLGPQDFENLKDILDTFGKRSAKAQGLGVPVTDIFRLRSTDQRLYLAATRHGGITTVHGGLKTGHKKLFLRTEGNTLQELQPTCVLDFYVHEGFQRRGLGKQLFQNFLEAEGIEAAALAYDRPSPKLMAFLAKHYGLRESIPQTNNFVVFSSFWQHNHPSSSARASRRGLNRQPSYPGPSMPRTSLPSFQPAAPWERSTHAASQQQAPPAALPLQASGMPAGYEDARQQAPGRAAGGLCEPAPMWRTQQPQDDLAGDSGRPAHSHQPQFGDQGVGANSGGAAAMSDHSMHGTGSAAHCSWHGPVPLQQAGQAQQQLSCWSQSPAAAVPPDMQAASSLQSRDSLDQFKAQCLAGLGPTSPHGQQLPPPLSARTTPAAAAAGAAHTHAAWKPPPTGLAPHAAHGHTPSALAGHPWAGPGLGSWPPGASAPQPSASGSIHTALGAATLYKPAPAPFASVQAHTPQPHVPPSPCTSHVLGSPCVRPPWGMEGETVPGAGSLARATPRSSSVPRAAGLQAALPGGVPGRYGQGPACSLLLLKQGSAQGPQVSPGYGNAGRDQGFSAGSGQIARATAAAARSGAGAAGCLAW